MCRVELAAVLSHYLTYEIDDVCGKLYIFPLGTATLFTANMQAYLKTIIIWCNLQALKPNSEVILTEVFLNSQGWNWLWFNHSWEDFPSIHFPEKCFSELYTWLIHSNPFAQQLNFFNPLASASVEEFHTWTAETTLCWHLSMTENYSFCWHLSLSWLNLANADDKEEEDEANIFQTC